MRLRTDKMGEGFDRLERRSTAIRDLHLWAGIHDLMERWERIIEQDNRMGVLANSDKDGKPAPRHHGAAQRSPRA
jgi:hypothetical protein